MSETVAPLHIKLEVGQDSGIVLAALHHLRGFYLENSDRANEYARCQIQNITNLITKLEAQL